eukprot:7303507-Ditylum_brightwellii.AAC.1
MPSSLSQQSCQHFWQKQQKQWQREQEKSIKKEEARMKNNTCQTIKQILRQVDSIFGFYADVTKTLSHNADTYLHDMPA